MDGLNKLPPDVTLAALSTDVFLILERFTAFPWPVMLSQCRRLGVDPERIPPDRLNELIPLLSTGVSRFTSPSKGREAEKALRLLTRKYG